MIRDGGRNYKCRTCHIAECKEIVRSLSYCVVAANRGRICLLASYLTVLYRIGLILCYLAYDYICHG